MNTTTINTLVRRIRQRSDMINSMTFDDATELKLWIKGSLSQLYELMVTRWNDFYVVRVPCTILGGVGTYALPSDFRALHDVWIISGTGRTRLSPFNAEEQDTFANAGVPAMYRTVAGNLQVIPVPQVDAFNGMEIEYTPQYRAPLLDYSPIDAQLPNGWEEWAVLDVMEKMATKTRLLRIGDVLDRKKVVERQLLSSSQRRTSDAPRMRGAARSGSIYIASAAMGPAFWAGIP